MTVDVGLKLQLDGAGQVQAGLTATGQAIGATADEVLKLERATAAAAAAQAKLDTATTAAARAQQAYTAAAKDSSTAAAQLVDLQQRAATASAAQATAAVNAKQSAAALQQLTQQHVQLAAQQKLTGNQTAQLSAQLQDLFVQIQSGGGLLTPLIQQGSQLSAVFGGFKPALQAVGSLFTVARVAAGGAAAAAVALGLAYKQGSDEVSAFGKALILSGNAAGKSVGQLQDLASAQSKIAGTQGKASEALAQLAASGQVAGTIFGKLTQSAVAFERAGGDSIEAVNKKFISLGKDSLQGLVKLNETENFLTKSLYDQVKALQDQGQANEAARVAQEGYASSLSQRTAQLESQLGTFEKAWRSLGDTAKLAWDKMLNVGRPQTLGDAVAEAERSLEAAQKRMEGKGRRGGTTGELRGGGSTQETVAAQELLATRQEGLRIEERISDAKATQAAQNKAYFDTEKLVEQSLSHQQQLTDQLAAARTKMELAGRSPQQIEAALRAITQSSAAFSENIAATLAKAAGTQALLVEQTGGQLQQLQAEYSRGLIRERQYLEDVAKAQQEVLKGEERRLEIALAQEKLKPNNRAGVIAAENALLVNQAAQENRQKQLRSDLTAVTDRQTKAIRDGMQALREEGEGQISQQLEQQRQQRKAMSDTIQAYRTSLDDAAYSLGVEAEAMGQTERTRSVMLEQLRIELDRRQKLRAIEATPYPDGGKEDDIAAVNQAAARAKAQAAAKIYQDEFSKTADQINKTLGDAVTDALMGDGANAGRALRRELIRIFSEPLTMQIRGMLQPVSNQLASFALGGQQGAAAGGMGGSLSQYSSLYSAGQKGWNWLTGGSSASSFAGQGSYLLTDSTGAGLSGMDLAADAGSSAIGSGGELAAGSSSAASAIPIIGWILAAIAASNSAYKAGNTIDMLDKSDRDWGVGAFETSKYRTLSAVGFSDKWAQILSGAPLTARLFGHKASSSGYGIGSVSQGDFVSDNITPFQYGDNTLGTGRNTDLEGLSSDVLAAVGIAAGNFGGKLKDGLRVGSFTDRDREGKVSALLGYFGSQNTLVAGTQTGTGSFGVGGPTAGGQKIEGADFEKWVAEQMPLLVIQGLQQSDLDKRFKDYFDSVDITSDPTKAADKAGAALETATNVAKITEAFKPLGGALGQLSNISVQSVADLAQASGGFDALGQKTASYYQNFYTDAERAGAATKNVSDALGKVGLTLPDLSQGADAANAAWRAMTDAQKLNTKEGKDAAATILGTSDAFAQLVAYADGLQKSVKSFDVSGFLGEDATSANRQKQLAEGFEAINRAVPKTRQEFGDLVHELVKGGTATSGLLTAVLDMVDSFDAEAAKAEAAAKKQADERAGLQTQILQLEGKTTELRAQERAELDPLNRTLYDRIKTLEDEKAVLDERKGLEERLLQLQGDTVELRNRERAALDSSNVAIYDQITALEDFKTASDLAATAVDRALTNLRRAVEHDIGAATDKRDKDLKDLAGQEKTARATHDNEIADIKSDRTDAQKVLAAGLQDFAAVNASLLKQGFAAIDPSKAKPLLPGDAVTFDDVRRQMDADAKIREAQFKVDLDAANTRIGSQTEIVNSLKGLSDSLKQTLQIMTPVGAELQSRQEGQFAIRSALEEARKTGKLPTAEDLAPSLQAVTADSSQFFSTQFEYLRDFHKTKNDVTQLSKITDGRLTIEGQQLTALEEARDLLVDGNEAAKTLMEAQLEAMRTQETLAKALYDKIDEALQLRTETADNKLTVDLSGLEVLKEQVNTDWETETSRLQGILENATEAVSVLTGQTDALMSVGQAMDQLTDALAKLDEFDPLKGLNALPGQLEQAIKNALAGGINGGQVVPGTGTGTGTSVGTGVGTGVTTGTGGVYDGSKDGEGGEPGGGGSASLWTDALGAIIYGAGNTPTSVSTKGGQVISINDLRAALNGYVRSGDYTGGNAYASQVGLSGSSIERLIGLTAGSWASFLTGMTVVGSDRSYQTMESIRAFVNQLVPDSDPSWNQTKGQTLRNWGVSQNVKAETVDEAMGYGKGYINQILSLYGVPAFAAGGQHAGGWAMVGEQGPELVNMAPARIYNSSDTMRMLSDPGRSNEVLASAVKDLQTENAAMRAEMKKLLEKIASNTEKSATMNAAMVKGPGVKTRSGS